MALKNRENELKIKISNYKSNVVDPVKLQEIYKEFYSIWAELDKPEKRNIIQILIKEIETRIAKNSNEGE
jgi:benzoyl-CoA reductase/2-hydroxyglutaryl-CoA dehydratase subunit BcrC/BadD/HgdB